MDPPLLFHATAQAIYQPRAPAHFHPERIIVAKSSLACPQRRALVKSIRAVYESAEWIEQLDVPHNRIDLGVADPLALHYRGKRTLVFAEHHSAVRRSKEEANTCPNYWHFSPYGFCPYDCRYRYLAATQGVRFSPTVKIFLNLVEIIEEIDRVASRIAEPTPFYLGKLQDGLALDPLTGYSRILVPFFAAHRYARLTVLTKSAEVDNVLDLDHHGHTILSWTVNPPEICQEFETNTPRPAERIEAMRKCVSSVSPWCNTPGNENERQGTRKRSASPVSGGAGGA